MSDCVGAGLVSAQRPCACPLGFKATSRGQPQGLPLHKGTPKNSNTSFSLWEKVGMRILKSDAYIPHPSHLPEGEGIFRGSHKYT